MKKALCFVALLAFVATATAGIDLFMTRGTDFQYVVAADRFNTNTKNFAFASAAPSPGSLGHGPFTQATGTETYYVWTHFTNLPVDGAGSIQIYGFGLMGSYATGTATVSGNYYKQASGTFQRWDTTDPMLLPGGSSAIQKSGVWTALAGTTSGTDRLIKDFDADGSYYALLGAISFTSGGQFFLGVKNPDPFAAIREYDDQDPPGIIHDYSTGAPDPNDPLTGGFYPDLTVMGHAYTHEAGTQPILAITPEPASMLLLALAGLLIRRR